VASSWTNAGGPGGSFELLRALRRAKTTISAVEAP
jgi:hypothetical protein